jgi:DNA polymerase/3'-5' exonuclease PolX
MNDTIINELKVLVNEIKTSKKPEPTDKFRIRSILNAISIISKISHKITSIKMLENTPGIGKGILSRIEEILETGKLSELKHNIPIDLLKFQELVGDVTARKLYNSGIKSIEELNSEVNKGNINVTHRIQLILKYYFGPIKFKEQIPHTEMKIINKSFKRAVKKFDPKLHYLTCGSFRRKKEYSNDIDILLFHQEDKKILSSFINYLIEQKFLIDHLTNNLSTLKTKYMGFCISTEKDTVRRIDIRLIEWKSRFTASLYFTGPKDFNTNMRSIAKKLGYKLSEYNLQETKTKKFIYPTSEKQIFDLLSMSYLEPQDRK